MKRRISFLCIFLTLCILFAACGSQEDETVPVISTQTTTAPIAPITEPTTVPTTEPPHVHNVRYTFNDHEGHGYGCECGEEIAEPHTLDEEGKCTVCDVYVRMEENGHYVVTTVYDSGMTARIEAFYRPIEPGSDEYYHYTSNYYDSDGYWRIIEYGIRGPIQSITNYDPDGNITSVETRTYEYDEHGGYELDIFQDGELVEERTYTMGPDGQLQQALWIRYHGEEIDFVSGDQYEYDESGRMIVHRSGCGIFWSYEVFFEYDEAGNRYTAREIRYDEKGQLLSDQYFDSKGNQIEP